MVIAKRLVRGCLMAIALGCANVALCAGEPAHLKLLAPLDRPDDGYCVDIPGAGRHLRVDLPLFAHNCKAGLTADSAVQWMDGQRLYFPGVRLCMTAAGINSRALAGAALLLHECGRDTAFFDVAALQRFELSADGRLTLSGTSLCVVVGAQSATTYSAADVWRTLFLETCADAPAGRARWELRIP